MTCGVAARPRATLVFLVAALLLLPRCPVARGQALNYPLALFYRLNGSTVTLTADDGAF
jgi:hypothetical protein